MKIFFIKLLQLILLLTGLAVLYGMIRLPQTEGRAKNLDLLHIYSDRFIIYGFLSSIPFFIALYKGFRLLGFIGQNKLYTSGAEQVLKHITYCAICCGVLIAGAGVFILITHDKADDPAGFLALCMILLFIASAVAIIATKTQKNIRNSIK